MWLCGVHNKVNLRLEKAEFDCNNVGDFSNCSIQVKISFSLRVFTTADVAMKAKQAQVNIALEYFYWLATHLQEVRSST